MRFWSYLSLRFLSSSEWPPWWWPFRAPAEKHALAVELAHRGTWCLVIGVGIVAAYWLFRRLKD